MITVEKNEFLEIIKVVKLSLGKNAITPIFSNMHIKSIKGGLEITATDGDISTKGVCPANITEPIDICVNGNSLENIVNLLDEIIIINLKENYLEVKSGKTIYKLMYINSNDFPIISFDLKDNKIVFAKDIFVDSIEKALISPSPVQGLLSGICFDFQKDICYITATDGNRLSYIEINNTSNIQHKLTVPHQILTNLIKNIKDEVEMYYDEKNIIFKTNKFLFKQNLLDGQYPDCNSLIPKDFKYTVSVDRSTLLKSLEKVAIMCDQRSNITRFKFKNNELSLKTKCENGEAEDTIEIASEGEIDIAMNYRYIIDALKVMKTDNVEFLFNNNSSATVIKGDFTYLCMPMIVKD